jgi:hypothetical protein
VAKDTWLGNWTVHRAKEEVEQTGAKDDRIVNLTDRDMNCIELWVRELERRLGDKMELKEMRASEISNVIKENTARYTLFRWTATGKDGGLKEVTLTPASVKEMSMEELNERRKALIDNK